MPRNIKGPAIFLAQFAGDKAPFNSWTAITKWAASLGYKGVQIPSWDGRLFDLKKAASSKAYCDEVKGIAKANGVEITELSTHLQGQLVAVHPAYDEAFDVQMELPRLREAFLRIQAQRKVLKDPGRFTPFAFPIIVDRLRERLSSEELEDRIRKMTERLEKG